MAEEIELKLAIDPADHRRFLAHPLLRTATARSDQILDNVYYDTPSHELRKKGVAVRLRKQGRVRLQTIKLAPSVIAGSGLSSRPEWETPFKRRFDFSVVSVASVRDWLLTPEISGRIGPMFQTRFRRITWHLPLPAGGEVLVALDRGYVAAGSGENELRSPISEVELELSGSTDTGALTRMAAELGARVLLTPSDTSKAKRGFTLLAAVTAT
jgi:inorganic triphosphatase YgiF